MAYELDHYFENALGSNVSFLTPLTTNVNLGGLDNMGLTLKTPECLCTNLELKIPEPIVTDSKFDVDLDVNAKVDGVLHIPEPIKTESKAELDIKPVALDQCLYLKLAPVPPTCVRQPYHQRVGYTVFGVEVFGFTLSGETQTVVSPMPEKPVVAWGAEKALTWPSSHQAKQPARAIPESGGGLRIRLAD